MYKDIDGETIMEADRFGLFIGIPYERVQLTGSINGSNKAFTIPEDYRPVYPKNSRSILPLAADVIVETLKGTTYTSVTVDSVDTITDTDTGDTIYGAVTVHTAPEAASADSIWITAVEELEPFVAQSVEPEASQDKTEVARIYSGNKMTSYGAIATTIKAEIIVTENTLRYLKKFAFRPMVSGDDGYSDVPVGYKGYLMRTQPVDMYAYTPVLDGDDDILGRFYYENVKIPAQFPQVKAGEQAKLTLELSVAGNVVWIEKDEA